MVLGLVEYWGTGACLVSSGGGGVGVAERQSGGSYWKSPNDSPDTFSEVQMPPWEVIPGSFSF